ncbi:DUF4350 domain-containing protein [Patulibacter defluvii]|uniref:DUF4350 domain-containing protein n=1 Tax=Patulibacter defluvii TaxID=3095358 RepID=UPI002A7565FF|nr:DUF4350 domain-containing protein [Patulibacter sp. DM4]
MKLRALLSVVGLVLVVLIVLGLFGSGGEDPPPRNGWNSAEDRGLAGWRALLRHEGVGVRVAEVDADRLRLLPRTTYLFAEGDLDRDRARRVLREARRGARVVAAGRDAIVLGRALGLPLASASGGPVARRARRSPETRSVDRVATGRGAVAWPGSEHALWALVTAGVGDVLHDPPVVVGQARVGEGTLLLLASRRPVENGGLGVDDNAALAVGLAGRGRVVALRVRDGAATAAGVSPRVGVVLALLVLAGVAALLSRGRRLGPAVAPDEDPAPSRSAYVDALAAALARTRDRDAALRPTRERARAILRRRVGLEPDAGPPELEAAALRAGLEPAAARALAGTGTTPDPRAAGQALAALEQRTTPGGPR